MMVLLKATLENMRRSLQCHHEAIPNVSHLS
jgi:hypothetical protein